MKPAELDMLTTLAPGLAIKHYNIYPVIYYLYHTSPVLQYVGNFKPFKPQDGKEDVTCSFVGPVVGGQGHLEGKISMGI